jgi:hypothetical protein
MKVVERRPTFVANSQISNLALRMALLSTPIENSLVRPRERTIYLSLPGRNSSISNILILYLNNKKTF